MSDTLNNEQKRQSQNLIGVYYDRLITVNVDDLSASIPLKLEYGTNLSQMRLSFEGVKTNKNETSVCSFKFHNLSEKTVERVLKIGARIDLEAGYKYAKGAGLLFSGFIQKVHSEYNGKEKTTIVEAFDGIDTFRNASAINSFIAGTPIKSALDDIRKTLRIPYYPRSSQAANELGVFPFPYSYNTTAEQALIDLSRDFKFQFDLVNNQLRIYRFVEVATELRFTFNYTTGLIDVPVKLKENGAIVDDLEPKTRIKVKTLLNHMVEVGDQIKVQWGNFSSTTGWQFEEQFNVLTHKFIGNNYDKEFYSIFEAETIATALDQKKADFELQRQQYSRG